MSEPNWLSLDLVIAFHDEQLRRFGGPAGIRDRGLLDSALARAPNKFAYGEKDLAALAAAYAFGIVRNRPFIDGNKRAALLSVVVFLGLNGIDFLAPEPEVAAAILSLAAVEIDETGLARWIAEKIRGD